MTGMAARRATVLDYSGMRWDSDGEGRGSSTAAKQGTWGQASPELAPGRGAVLGTDEGELGGAPDVSPGRRGPFHAQLPARQQLLRRVCVGSSVALSHA